MRLLDFTKGKEAVSCQLLAVSLLLLPSFAFAELPSSFNDQTLEIETLNLEEGFSFLVGGHLYGAPRNTESVYPSSTLLGNIHTINDLDVNFFMGLGDLTRSGTTREFEFFESSFTNRLDIAFYNAIGNHDAKYVTKYENRYGATSYDFVIGPAAFFVLDTERDGGEILGDQWEEFGSKMMEWRDDENIQTIFIFSHKMIWALNERFTPFMSYSNAYNYPDGVQYEEQILPLLREVAKTKKIQWISGDTGVRPAASLFYDQEEEDIALIATGIGDRQEDILLEISVSSGGVVSYKPIPLTDHEFYRVETYTTEFWKTLHPEDAKTVLAKYQAKMMRVIGDIYFRIGLSVGIGLAFVTFIVSIFLRRKKSTS